MELQYTKINDLLDRYLNLYNNQPTQASNLTISSASSQRGEQKDRPMTNSVFNVQQQDLQKGPENNEKAEQKIDYLTATARIDKSEDIINNITQKYKLNRDDVAKSAIQESITSNIDETIRNIQQLDTNGIIDDIDFTKQPISQNPIFQQQHARAVQNLIPQTDCEDAHQKQVKVSKIEQQSLYAEIQRLKLMNQVQKQTILDLNQDLRQIKKVKKVQSNSRQKFQLLKDELAAANERISQLEARERKYQDLIAELRRK